MGETEIKTTATPAATVPAEDKPRVKDAQGRFVKGNQAGKGYGRPPKAREAALLAIGATILQEGETWANIIRTAIADALGLTLNSTNTFVPDPASTAQGRNVARTFLRDTFIGRPTEYINPDPTQSAYEQFSQYSSEELRIILDVLTKFRPTRGNRGADSAGAEETGEPAEAV